MTNGTTRMTLCWSPVLTNRIPVTLAGYKLSCLIGTETSSNVRLQTLTPRLRIIATERNTTPWASTFVAGLQS